MSATDTLVLHIRAAGLPAPVLELRFHPTRRWRFDLAWPQWQLAIEIEGGIWGKGGRRSAACRLCGARDTGHHARGVGILRDIEKGNAAILAGYRVLRVTPDMVNSGEALKLIERVIRADIENRRGA
jgi:hypothetical protein